MTARVEYAAQTRNAGVREALASIRAGIEPVTVAEILDPVTPLKSRDVYVQLATTLLKTSVERQMWILTGVEVTLP